MPLEKDARAPKNHISEAMRHDEEEGHSLQTWNTCPKCGTKWKDAVRTEGILHRTILCGNCK